MKKIIFKRKPLLFSLLMLLCFSLGTTNRLSAQDASVPGPLQELLSVREGESTQANQPSAVIEMAILAGIALLPFAIMLLTSYLKMVIVLSLMRNAIGVQNSPPNQVLTGIALIMAIYVMYPTGVAMYKASEDFIKESAPKELFSDATAYFLMGVVERAKEPMRTFLIKNTSSKNTQMFYRLATKNFSATAEDPMSPTDFIVVIPAYITSQLRNAFEIGVLIYLPFFVIDLVTSNILLAMGMMMLSPLTIALPLKLLLVVMVDGWTLVIDGIVKTFR
ncbi:MAG TPA: type III secretion system export apparatus subunit SctR [Chlamydiales bacterium]|nr:type III secretion system export apparatus subunit SctR [Chlamydiales bacterium]